MVMQYKKATKEPNQYVKFAIKSADEPHIWYILLNNFAGNDEEFEGGEYLVRMEAPQPRPASKSGEQDRPGFPFEPPHFYMLTHNGVYGVDKKVCISIGEFHADQYRATLGMSGFADNLVSGLIGWRELGGGIEIKTTTAKEKAKLAKESVASNYEQYPEIMELINTSYAAYSAKFGTGK
jgi:ubiquitin-protein ligase